MSVSLSFFWFRFRILLFCSSRSRSFLCISLFSLLSISLAFTSLFVDSPTILISVL